MFGQFITRELRIRLAILGFSFLFIFVTGEVVCRIFIPDTQLRYIDDADALYYLEPNQVGACVTKPTRLHHVIHERTATWVTFTAS